jgi:hypothetical protein
MNTIPLTRAASLRKVTIIDSSTLEAANAAADGKPTKVAVFEGGDQPRSIKLASVGENETVQNVLLCYYAEKDPAHCDRESIDRVIKRFSSMGQGWEDHLYRCSALRTAAHSEAECPP